MAFLVFPSKSSVRATLLRRQRKHLLEFPTSCRRRKCLTNCCSKFIARRSCPILWARRRSCQRRMRPLRTISRLCPNLCANPRAMPLWEPIVRRRRSALDFDARHSAHGAQAMWNSSWTLRREIGQRTGVAISAARATAIWERAPIS